MKVDQKKWRGKRVLITGGGGFLGSWLSSALVHAGATVVVLDIKACEVVVGVDNTQMLNRVTYLQGNVCDALLVRKILFEFDVQYVFHLAAEPIVGDTLTSPARTFETNIRGTWELLEACRTVLGQNVCIVVASTDKAYGTHESLPYTEESELRGEDHPYDCSKGCMDRISRMFARVYSLPVAVTRCGNIFGGGDLHFSRLIPGLMKAHICNESFSIRSDGTFLRDYVYVKDIVSAYLTVATAVENGARGVAYNFGNNDPKTVLEMIDLTKKIFKNENFTPVIENTAQNEIRDQYLDSKKARTELQWKPLYNIEIALQETKMWYEKYFNSIHHETSHV